MLIEICIEHKQKVIFSATFDTLGDRTFKEFRAHFYSHFSLKHPRIRLEGPDIRETWRQLHAAPPTSDKTAPRRSNSVRLL